MWKRRELKAKAKTAFKANYWAYVLVAVIIVTTALGSVAGFSAFAPSAGSISLASKATPAFATEDIDEIRNLDFDEILSGLDLDTSLPSSLFDNPALFAVLGAIIAFIVILILFAIAIKILIFNPIFVAGYQFFKENALEKTNGLKFDFNNKYKNVVLGMFLRSLFVALWSLLFLIPGIVKSYSYRMVPFILTDNPDITATEAISLSCHIMKGNKWRAFVLDLSFIGWYLLSAFTFGILSIFYVNPYVYATEAELYHAIKNN